MLSNKILIATAVFLGYMAVLSASITLYLLNSGAEENEDQKMRATIMTILAVGSLLWPLIWYLSIGSVVLQGNSVLPLFGAFWPQIMLLLDLRATKQKGLTASTNNLIGSLQEDANSLIGIAFAFAMMMVATYANQRKEMYSAMLMVLFALVICIAFVVPQPLAKEKSNQAFVWATCQRVVFAYAMGFLLTALCLTISVGSIALANNKG
jgi:hypothetical protein